MADVGNFAVQSLQSLDCEDSAKIIAAAETAARDAEAKVCVAVVDRGGHLLAFVRMHAAPIMSIQLAQDKAYSVAAFNGLPTHEWPVVLANDPDVSSAIGKTDRLIMFGGGMPVLHRGSFVGAVGVSGGTAEQDRAIAEIAAQSLSPRVK